MSNATLGIRQIVHPFRRYASFGPYEITAKLRRRNRRGLSENLKYASASRYNPARPTFPGGLAQVQEMQGVQEVQGVRGSRRHRRLAFTLAASVLTPVTVAGCDSSICSHMPGACATPELHWRSVVASLAVWLLWLAVSFHPSGSPTLGTELITSAVVHGVLRDAVAARTRATSAGATRAARLPNAFRT